MIMSEMSNEKNVHYEEIAPKAKRGMPVLLINSLAVIACLIGFIYGILLLENGSDRKSTRLNSSHT